MTDFSEIFKLNTGVFEAPNVVSPVGKKIDKSDPIYIQGLKGEKGDPGEGGGGEIDIPGTGLVKTASGILSLAVAGTDYLAPTGNGSALTGLTKTQVGLSNVDNTSDLAKPISTATQTALDGKVDENSSITGATKTKITYDSKGLVTAGADATTADIADSSNKRYVTDAQLTVIGNTSGTNSGNVTVTDSAEIDFTLTGQNITASIIAGSIDETKLDASTNSSLDLADSSLQPAAIGTTVQGYSAILAATTASFLTAHSTKLGFITVTQAVDLDTIESDTAANNAKVTNATHTGDVTGSTALTIANDAVTLAKMANMATASLIYRKTAGTGDPEVQTLATLKTDLGLTGTNSGDQTSIVGITGTKSQFDTACTDGNFLYVGDVTSNATHTGDVTGATALTIANDAVTYAKMQNVSATDKLLGRSTAGSGDVEEIDCTAAGRALLDDVDASAQRATLGLVIGTNVQAYSSVLAATTASFLTADETKLDFITITQAVNLDTLESDTATNNAKVTNATHTGEITGSTALTLDKTAITNRSSATIASGDLVLISDISDSNNLKYVTAGDIAALASSGVTDGDKGEIVVSASGTVWNIDTASTPQMQRVGIGQAASSTISEAITIGTSTHVGIEVKGAASQSANFLNFRDSAATLISGFTKDGYYTKGSTRFMHWSGNASFPGAFLGSGAGNTTTTGSNNAGFGSSALSGISSGSNNLAIGGDASRDLSTGSDNVAIGAAANYLNISGARNTAIGRNALAAATADDNIGIGSYAGDNITTGTNNVIIGSNVDAPVATTNGQLSIQNMIFGTGNTATGTSYSTGNIGIGYNDPQARLHIIKTTEQLRVGYDTSNYFSATVDSSNKLVINAGTSDGADDAIIDINSGGGVGKDRGSRIILFANEAASNPGNVYIDAGNVSGSKISLRQNDVTKLTIESAVITAAVDVVVPDEAYGSGWDGSLEVPTKNAIYDKIEAYVYSGSYTPVAVLGTNAAAATTYSSQYMKVGNAVTVSGQIDIDPTATGNTLVYINLPIASALSDQYDVGGVFASATNSNFGGIYADFANDRALFRFNSTTTANGGYHFTFTYELK